LTFPAVAPNFGPHNRPEKTEVATTNSRQPALNEERIDLGGGVSVDLKKTAVVVQFPNYTESVGFAFCLYGIPRTRQEANRMSIALKKASRRLQAIGSTLPEETGGSR
jgi:hypothetical protein